MSPGRDIRLQRLRLPAALAGAYVVFFAVFMSLNPAGARASVWVDDGSTALVAVVAFAASLCRARRSTGRRRVAWAWMTAATGAWAVGECIWDWYALIRNLPVPSPSLADVFYLSGVPLAVVAIVLFAGKDSALRRGARFALDGLVIAGSFLFISWSTALGVVYRLGGGPLLSRVVDIAYPVTDVIMATAAFAAWSSVRRGRRLELGLVGSGLLAFSVADSAYSYFTYTGSYGNGNVFDSGYIAGYLVLALAALVAQPAQREDQAEARQLSTAQVLLPYAPLCLAAALAAYRVATGGRFDPLLVGVGFFTVVAVLLRQLLTLAENKSLAGRLELTVAALTAREAELAHQASHDPLTGLSNRVLFADRVDHALARQRRTGECSALMVCDLDDFKTVNDTMGHLIGDEVLRIVASRFNSTLRECDTVARLGGDEFGILIEGVAGPEAASHAAHRLIEALQAPLKVGGHTFSLSTSIGLTITDRITSAGKLLQAADVALYGAKGNGKATVAVFEPRMMDEMLSNISMKSDLALLASSPEQLEIHYQPIIDLRSGRFKGVEALVRWRHPSLGLLYPDAFIETAEQTGAIVPIGAAVLDKSCAQVVDWRSAGFECPSLAVNVSARQLRDPDLVSSVRNALARYDMPAAQLTLEVTESIMLHEREVAVDRLNELSALGVRIAIDDFGTGYSSLEYLRRLPVNLLKIDRSFTRLMDADDTTVVLVDLMTQLAHALGVTTVVEGIETPAQMRAVRLLSCDEGQGYLFARPGPPSSIEDFLARESAELEARLVSTAEQ